MATRDEDAPRTAAELVNGAESGRYVGQRLAGHTAVVPFRSNAKRDNDLRKQRTEWHGNYSGSPPT